VRRSFSVTPSRWLVRLAIAPLAVTFDSATRSVVRYEGRVPPMRDDGGRLRTLDARVEYVMAAAAYGWSTETVVAARGEYPEGTLRPRR
jgi:hypothetical protein